MNGGSFSQTHHVVKDVLAYFPGNLIYNIMLSGGMLDASIISFQYSFDVQSALVVGSRRILDILYNPSANQTKLKNMYTSFAVDKSTFCSCPNALLMFKMLASGDMMAMLVMLIEKMFNWFPDMYIMKAFINICCPGFIAIDIA